MRTGSSIQHLKKKGKEKSFSRSLTYRGVLQRRTGRGRAAAAISQDKAALARPLTARCESAAPTRRLCLEWLECARPASSGARACSLASPGRREGQDALCTGSGSKWSECLQGDQEKVGAQGGQGVGVGGPRHSEGPGPNGSGREAALPLQHQGREEKTQEVAFFHPLRSWV